MSSHRGQQQLLTSIWSRLSFSPKAPMLQQGGEYPGEVRQGRSALTLNATIPGPPELASSYATRPVTLLVVLHQCFHMDSEILSIVSQKQVYSREIPHRLLQNILTHRVLMVQTKKPKIRATKTCQTKRGMLNAIVLGQTFQNYSCGHSCLPWAPGRIILQNQKHASTDKIETRFVLPVTGAPVLC